MLIKKYILYIVILFSCLLFTNCEFLELFFQDLFIDEPPDGLETTDNLIRVKGHGTNKEINEVELLFNDSFVDVNEVERDNEDEDYCSFEFLNVFIPTGDIKIEVIGYSNWPLDEIDSDDVSIFCDRSPPNIAITSPLNDDIIYSDSVTFIGTVSDNDEVTSFTYTGEHGHSGDINFTNGDWSVTIESLPYAYQYVTFIAQDRLGNTKEKTMYFTCSE